MAGAAMDPQGRHLSREIEETLRRLLALEVEHARLGSIGSAHDLKVVWAYLRHVDLATRVHVW